MFTTKYSARIWLVSLVILAAVFSVLLYACAPSENVRPTPTPFNQKVAMPIVAKLPIKAVGGGDCSADRAKGDLYKTPDGYCLTGSEKVVEDAPEETLVQIVVTKTKKFILRVTETVTATVSPTPSSTPTGTVSPTVSPTQVTYTPSPTEPSITSTPKPPTETPTVPPTVKPTKTPPPTVTPEPTKECSNKNDDKKPGENPTDCNAGGGNG